MIQRDNNTYLKDILESIEIIFSHANELNETDFSKNLLVVDAVIRRFEIIGEAASRVSVEFKNVHPEIEWNLMKDMRNKLSHEYFGISPSTIYSTIKNDLPILHSKVSKLISQ